MTVPGNTFKRVRDILHGTLAALASLTSRDVICGHYTFLLPLNCVRSLRLTVTLVIIISKGGRQNAHLPFVSSVAKYATELAKGAAMLRIYFSGVSAAFVGFHR